MMELALQTGQTLLAFVGVLTVIVFIHEMGHFTVARLCGVRILAFSIGFGKELFGYTDRKGTRWKFSVLPLGGYVKMFGDTSEASTPDRAGLAAMTPAERSQSFYYQPLPKKAAIVAAGPLANFILTIAILTGFIFYSGVESTEAIVGEVMPGTAAEEAGLKAGDRILTIDGREVEHFGDIPAMIATNLGHPVHLTIDRSGRKRELDLSPRLTEDDDGLGNRLKRPIIGIKSQKMTYADIGFFAAVGKACERTWELTELTFRFIGQLISGERSASELKGTIGIAKMSGQAAHQGLFTIAWFVALLSANLGLVNLFPIPPLDGGHLLYYVIEGVRGRPLAEKFQEYGFRAGFALILMLMAFTVYNDIRQF